MLRRLSTVHHHSCDIFNEGLAYTHVTMWYKSTVTQSRLRTLTPPEVLAHYATTGSHSKH